MSFTAEHVSLLVVFAVAALGCWAWDRYGKGEK